MSTTLVLHQTHHTLADFENIAATLKESLKGDGLHLFPELFLTGYPLQDLCLQRAFIDSYHVHFKNIDEWLKSCPKSEKWRGLVPGLHYELAESGLPKKIENVVFEAIPGVGLQKIYTKRLLPNYDIFDEKKYFVPGDKNCFYEFQGKLLGILVCEDMWASSFHKDDPCDLMYKEMKEKNLKLNMIINVSGSPFDVAKKRKRVERAKDISLRFKCPFAYINRVGGEDEILFDGSSFIVAGENLVVAMKTFEKDIQEVQLEKIHGLFEHEPEFQEENTWEGLFSPQLITETKPATMRTWNDDECEDVLKALKFGLQEYARKSGFKKFLVALSGGMDSALVLAIVKLSLTPGQELEAIYMPSIHSASLSTQLCEDMCRRIKVPLQHLPIKFLHAAVKNAFTTTFVESFDGLVDENIQSRLRGALLYTRSNQTGAMVINTSNKSELAVGYSTQYGDSVGAISLLGDLYKTEVYRIAQYVNEKYGEPIPPGIIGRGPSAELRQNQLDQDSLLSMTFPKDISDHNKQNLTQKCIYMVGQFKGKDDTLYAQYKERLATLKPEESWDFFHEMLVAYQNLSGTTPSTSSKPQPKVANKKPEQKKASAPVAKVVEAVKKTVEKTVAKVEKKVEKEVKKAVKKVAKKVAKAPAKKAPAKKAAPPAKKAAAPKKKAAAKAKPAAKKAAPKKAAKKKKK